jgi:predicted metal-dependent HD superfamily phosphohydrolase
VTWLIRDRWLDIWRSLGKSDAPAGWYERLTTAYAEPHRHYHNQQHIAECLKEFDTARYVAKQPAAIEFALWFHDAVYNPKAADNEEQSAALLKRCAADGALPDSFIETSARFVMATKTHEAHGDCDAALMIDVDLSILGQDEKRFFEYEQQISREYSWVPENVFAFKRAEILNQFLSRPTIFMTDLFRSKYEEQARHNLTASISALRQTIAPG